MNSWCRQKCRWISLTLYWVKEANLKGYAPYDPIYMIFWKKQNYRDRERINDYHRLGLWRGIDYKRAEWGHFGGWWNPFIFWLWYGYIIIHSSKFIKLYTKNNKIFPKWILKFKTSISLQKKKKDNLGSYITSII